MDLTDADGLESKVSFSQEQFSYIVLAYATTSLSLVSSPLSSPYWHVLALFLKSATQSLQDSPVWVTHFELVAFNSYVVTVMLS